jgi:hypothetical protein
MLSDDTPIIQHTKYKKIMKTNLNNQPFYNIPDFRDVELSQLDLTHNTEEYPNTDKIYKQSLDLLYFCVLPYKHRFSHKIVSIEHFKNAAIHNIAKYNLPKSPQWLLSQIKSKQTLLPSDKISSDKAKEVENQEFDWTSINEFYIQPSKLNLNKTKSDLPALYMTSNCGRPRTTNHEGQHINQFYNNWTGFYPIDLDLKHLFPNCKNDENEMKRAIKFTKKCVDFIHENLKYQPWYMLTKRSHSKIGIHVFTTVDPTILQEDNNDIDNSLDAEIIGAKMKKSFMYTTMHHNYIIYQLLKQFGIKEDKLNDNGAIIDGMMLKISQLIKLSVDDKTKYSHALKQLPVDDVLNMFPSSVDPITIKEIEQIPFFQKLYSDWLGKGKGKGNNSRVQKKINTDTDEQYTPSYIIDGNNPDDIRPIDFQQFNKGNKHKARISVVNALHFLFDGKKRKMKPFFDAFFANDINESNAFYNSSRAVAPMNHTIRLMSEHGFKFNTSQEDKVLIAEYAMRQFSNLQKFKNLEPLTINTKPTIINLDGDKFKYVSDKKDQLLSVLQANKLNLIESAPGTGKTEFFKTLAKESASGKMDGKRILLAMPYTSVIKNKVENEKFGAVCYGDMKLEEAMKDSTFVTCTFDKLGNIFTGTADRLLSNFDYVVVDESQIQFDSDFRNQVMGKLIENIVTSVKQTTNDLLFENKTYFVWMTGTTLFEQQYLEAHGILNYVKVEKTHPFKKEITQKFTPYSEFIPLLMATEIKDAYLNDEKVMIPINEGDEKITKIIEYASVMLGKELKYNIFKKANINDQHVIDILESGIFPTDCDVLFATNYCSVGIDIKASYDARIICNGENFTPQQVEQFCNRFRSNDLFCSVYYGALIKGENDIPEIKGRLLNQDAFIIPQITTDDVYKLATEMVVNKYRETCTGEDITTNKFYSMMMVKKNDTWVPSSYMMELVLLQNKFTKYSQSSIYHKGKFLEYGYTVDQDIINHEGIIEQYEEMKEHNKKVSRRIKKERTSLYLEFIELLLVDEVYKTKDSDIIKSNNLVKFEEDTTGNIDTIVKGYEELNKQVSHIIFNKKYRAIYEEAKSDAFKLGKNYSGVTAISLIKGLINEKEVIKKSDKNNTINLVKMFKIEKDGSISPSSLKFLKAVRTLFDADNTSKEEIIISFDEYQKLMKEIESITINQFSESVATTVDDEVLGIFRNEYMRLNNEEIRRQAINDQRIQNQIQNNIKALCKVRKKGDGYKMQLRTIPAFDNNQYLTAINADVIMEALFGKAPEVLVVEE